jgi:hypothetical protein
MELGVKTMSYRILGTLVIGLSATSVAYADSESLTPEPSPETYNFVTHYRVQIDAPKEQIWPYLVNLKSWMYEFELSTISGTLGNEGQILRLYTDQDFKVQVTKVIPGELIAIVNLPMTFKGEFVTGIGVITLHQTKSGTEVSLTMSRRYTWAGEGENPLRATRSSEQFQDETRSMWQDRFLERLKNLAEGNPVDA